MSAFAESYFVFKAYLKPSGWFQSRFQGYPVDGQGNPIPWFTYSALYFLSKKDLKNYKVFEFGSGQSTFWFSDRCAKVVAVDHDANFFSFLENKIKSRKNVLLKLQTEINNYVAEVSKGAEKFDIIIVDGIERVSCCQAALLALADRGIIILDDADRPEYAPAHRLLQDAGLIELPFFGTKPITHFQTLTSIYYRQGNNIFDL